MRLALPASAILHASFILGAWAFLNWPAPDDASLESLSVDIISMEEFTSNAPSEVASIATENMIAAGAEAVPQVEPEPLEPTETEVLPETTGPIEVAEIKLVEEVEVEEVVPTTAEPQLSGEEAVELVEPTETETLEPATKVEPTEIEPLEDVDPTEVASIEPLASEIEAPTAPTTNGPDPVEPAASAEPELLEPTEAVSLPVLTASVTVATPLQGVVPLPSEALPADTVKTVTPLEELPPTEVAATVEPSKLPLEPETDTPAAPQRVAELDPNFDPARPVTVVPTKPLKIEPVDAEVAFAMVESVRPASLEPVEVTEVETAPVPRTRTVKQKTEPTFPEKTAEKKPKTTPVEEKLKKKVAEEPAKKKAAEEQPKKKRAASKPGKGGENNADSAAAPQSGGKGKSDAAGDAVVSKYPGQVQAKLRRALRYPKNGKGASGEVHVQFVVSANGSASSIRVVRSSGSPVLDDAAIETVRRAAPFPAIPAAAGRTFWDFTMPLVFQR